MASPISKRKRHRRRPSPAGAVVNAPAYKRNRNSSYSHSSSRGSLAHSPVGNRERNPERLPNSGFRPMAPPALQTLPLPQPPLQPSTPQLPPPQPQGPAKKNLRRNRKGKQTKPNPLTVMLPMPSQPYYFQGQFAYMPQQTPSIIPPMQPAFPYQFLPQTPYLAQQPFSYAAPPNQTVPQFFQTPSLPSYMVTPMFSNLPFPYPRTN